MNADAIPLVLGQHIGALIPPGGRMWLAYEAFDSGDLHRETQAGLAAGAPLVTTAVGHVLLRAGCWSGLRDWYIAEGGREGPRKLQGNKPVDAWHAEARARDLVQEVEAFMARPAEEAVRRRAQTRGGLVLRELRAMLSATGASMSSIR